jgi:hypothetical protein
MPLYARLLKVTSTSVNVLVREQTSTSSQSMGFIQPHVPSSKVVKGSLLLLGNKERPLTPPISITLKVASIVCIPTNSFQAPPSRGSLDSPRCSVHIRSLTNSIPEIRQ